MTKQMLWNLRQEISLNSMYYSDYRNSLSIDEHAVCDFFDGYLEFLSEIMQEEILAYDDAEFFDWLPVYDNAENLWNWYGCFEDDPLPLDIEESIAA